MKVSREAARQMLRAIFTKSELLEITKCIGGYAIWQDDEGNHYNAKDAWRIRNFFQEAWVLERDKIEEGDTLTH